MPFTKFYKIVYMVTYNDIVAQYYWFHFDSNIDSYFDIN